MQITLEQVHDIVNSCDGDQAPRIASFSEIKSTSYSYTASWKPYHVALSDSDRSYLLLIAGLHPRSNTSATPSGPVTLPALSTLLIKILDSTAVPVPRPVAHDVEGKWGFGWLLLRLPSGSSQALQPLASARKRLSAGQLAHVERGLGAYLRALHEITNDWFGVPTDEPTTPEPPSMPSLATLLAAGQTGEDGEDMTRYSWQDTFVLRLEELIERVCDNAETGWVVDLDVNRLRHSLSRAIGSFLFDDVEIPRFIWVTGNAEDVIVSLKDKKQCSDGDNMPSEEDTEAEIAYILPAFGHALWGDPLMEAWFLPPGPTAAMNEGYFRDEQDGALMRFQRHKTKRVWYTVYLALTVLAEEMEQGEAGETTHKPGGETTRWARSILPECVEILKDAPCY